jgi:hypothetical protein|tara:strand:- start:602 stop:721 length:120 start_codon:yes stop_codon:yes gene_type:complete
VEDQVVKQVMLKLEVVEQVVIDHLLIVRRPVVVEQQKAH